MSLLLCRTIAVYERNEGALTLGPVVPYRAEARLSPLPSPPAGLHSHCSGLTEPEHARASWSMECDPYFQKLNLQSKRQSQIFPPLFIWTLFAAVCLNLRWILHRQSQRCRCSVLVLVHVCPHRTEAQLFQLCRQSLPCLNMEPSANTSQTTWTLGVKRAQAWYRLPNVSAP